MTNNSVFNASVCIIGILILIIHVANILTKKEKRKDEKALLTFFLFTIIHFATYLTFTLVKVYYRTGDAYEYRKDNPDAIRMYRGEYMAQYSWAIFES